MAKEAKKDEQKKAPRKRKQPETVRERAVKVQAKSAKQPKSKKIVAAAGKPVQKLRSSLKKEYHPVKLPDNKLGSFLTKNRKLIPKYFKESWKELRQVQWPNRRQTAKLTFAVFIFAIVFATIIKLVDLGFEQIFKKILLG